MGFSSVAGPQVPHRGPGRATSGLAAFMPAFSHISWLKARRGRCRDRALLLRLNIGVAIGAVMPSVFHLGGTFRSWLPATSPTACALRGSLSVSQRGATFGSSRAN